MLCTSLKCVWTEFYGHFVLPEHRAFLGDVKDRLLLHTAVPLLEKARGKTHRALALRCFATPNNLAVTAGRRRLRGF